MAAPSILATLGTGDPFAERYVPAAHRSFMCALNRSKSSALGPSLVLISTQGRVVCDSGPIQPLAGAHSTRRINYGQFSTNGRIVSWAGAEMAATSC